MKWWQLLFPTRPEPEVRRSESESSAERELRLRDRMEAKVETEINRLWSAHGKVVSFLTVCVLIAGIFFGKSCSEMRETARTVAKEEADKVRSAIQEQLKEEFKQENIKQTIDNAAKEEVAKQATPLISSNISERIEPMKLQLAESLERSKQTETKLFASLQEAQQAQDDQLAEYEQSANELRSLISQATNTLEELKEVSTFTTDVVLAGNDSREAFESLTAISVDAKHPRASQAYAIVKSIAATYYISRQAYFKIDWDSVDPKTNRHSWTMVEIQRTWRTLVPSAATAYIEFVNTHTNITAEQRIAFLRQAYLYDSRNSLQAANKAAESVAKHFGKTHTSPFVYNDLETAWTNYTRKHSLFTSDKATSTNMVYERFPTTDLNKRTVLHKTEERDLVAFYLKHVPKHGTLEGKWLNYSNALTGEFKPLTRFDNVVFLNTSASLTEACKFEFRYVPDLTVEPIPKSFVIPSTVVDSNGASNFIELRRLLLEMRSRTADEDALK